MLTPSAFEDRRSSQGRLTAVRVIATVIFAGLAIAFWMLQIVGNAKYREMAENNHLRTLTLRAPRGALFDRHGRVLVENRPAYTIALIRERSLDLNAAVSRLAAVLGLDEARVRETVRARQRDPLYQAIAVVEHATDAQVAAVMARRFELPEVVVQEVPVRAYPADRTAAHLMGYVNEITAEQLRQPEYAGYAAGAMVGQAGVERVYNARLMGQDGRREVFVNSQNQEVGEPMLTEHPVSGERLQLTIDYDVQRALEEAFRSSGFSGAAIFMDPQTGEILAMTSQPDYDPKAFASGLDGGTWARLVNDPLKPMNNRLIQGRYSPGSTFKILMAVAGLQEGVITPETTFRCNGSAVFYGRAYACDKKEGHGSIDLRHAIEKSCNVYFYNIGDRLTVDKIHEYGARLGLVGRTGIDLPGEVESFLPTAAWKQRVYRERWYPSETISVAIGQGFVDLTPVALATMLATVANGGTVVTPHAVRAVDDGQGWRPVDAPAPRSAFPLAPGVRDPVIDGLWLAVNGAGTAGRARLAGYDVVGKTGTAQVISNEGRRQAAGRTDRNLADHSWFVFFAPRDRPRIAGVVIAEHAGHGGTAAAPIARHVLGTFFAKQDGRPFPVWTGPLGVPATAPAPAGGGR